MDWIDDENENHRGIDAAFTIINEGPPPLTARQQKTKRDQQDSFEAAARQLILDAYPPLYQNETEKSRLERSTAFEKCWSTIERRIQSALESTDTQVFSSLLSLARNSHPSRGVPSWVPKHGLHRIPTGVVLAGGVNSADHVRTFPNLAAYLRQAGCYVALLSPPTLSSSLTDTFKSALSQLSGIQDTSADQFEALTAWYADEVGAGCVRLSPSSPPLHPPSHRLREITATMAQPQKNQSRRTTLALHFPDPDTNTALDDSHDHHQPQDINNPPDTTTTTTTTADVIQNAVSNTNHHPRLRARSLSQLPSTTINGEPVLTPVHTDNRKRPIVLIIESIEGSSSPIIADFISILSEGYPRLPITLVLGITTTAAALQAAIPSHLIDRALECHHYNLATAMTRLEYMVKNVLLGSWPCLLIDEGIISTLWEMFLLHYFSPGIVVQGWKVAALEHFRSQPFSQFVLISALTCSNDDGINDGINSNGGVNSNAIKTKKKNKEANFETALRNACGKFDAFQLQELHKAMSRPSPLPTGSNARGGHSNNTHAGNKKKEGLGAVVVSQILDMVDAWRTWSLAIHWIVLVAKTLNLSNGYTHWQLYRDALTQEFITHGAGKERIGKLIRSIASMDEEGAHLLIKNMISIVFIEEEEEEEMEDTHNEEQNKAMHAVDKNQHDTTTNDEKTDTPYTATLYTDLWKSEKVKAVIKDLEKIQQGILNTAPTNTTITIATTIPATSTATTSRSTPDKNKKSKKNGLAGVISPGTTSAEKKSKSKTKDAAIEAGIDENPHQDAHQDAHHDAQQNQENQVNKKKDRYHSKATRKAALLSKAQAQGKVNAHPHLLDTALHTTEGHLDHVSTATQLARFLSSWLLEILRVPPTHLQGASLFTCKGASSLECLSAAPRQAIHAALTTPQMFYGNVGDASTASTSAIPRTNPGTTSGTTYLNNIHLSTVNTTLTNSMRVLGMSSTVAEDVCLAYSIFDQDSKCSNVADWFVAFKELHTKSTKKKSKNGVQGNGGKKKGENAKNNSKKKKSDEKNKNDDDDDQRDHATEQVSEEELIARFSQAAAELQYLGLVRPAKKRRGDHVQRAVHMPSALLGDI